MNKKLWICSAFLCTGMSFSQQAQNEAETLEEVVLIDSKFQLKRENSGKVIAKITAEELEKSRGLSLPEVINRVSGIEINGARSVDGQNLGYYVRGGRNRQVVILVDGVQLTDPSSIANDFDLRLLPLDQVESIEIIKGASSTLYGSGAAAAVINITTKDPVNREIGLQLQTVLGTNNTQQNQDYDIALFDNSVGVSGRLSKFDYQVNFSNRYSENMSAIKPADENEKFEEDPFRKYNAYARLGYRFNRNIKFHVYGNFDKFNAAFDDAFMYADANNNLESEQLRVGTHLVAAYSNGSFNFSNNYSEQEREVTSDYPNRYDSKFHSLDAHNKYIFNDNLHTVLGVNAMFSEFNSYSVPFGGTAFEQSVSEEVANFDIIDPYLNVVYTSGFGFNLNTGARLNIHSEYDSHWVYNLNPSYNLDLGNDNLKFLASYSTAYITPSLYQLYNAAYGNTNLQPEESATIEGGLEYTSGPNRFSAVYFRRNSENFVDFVVVDPETFTYQYQNVADQFTASGVEVEFNLHLSEALSLGGNYTFTEAAEQFGLRIPKHKMNAALGYQIAENTFTSLSYQFNDERTDSYYNSESYQNEIIVLDSYGLLDFYISHRFSENFKAFAGVTNLTNEDFEEVYRFNTKGRNARLGLVFNF